MKYVFPLLVLLAATQANSQQGGFYAQEPGPPPPAIEDNVELVTASYDGFTITAEVSVTATQDATVSIYTRINYQWVQQSSFQVQGGENPTPIEFFVPGSGGSPIIYFDLVTDDGNTIYVDTEYYTVTQ